MCKIRAKVCFGNQREEALNSGTARKRDEKKDASAKMEGERCEVGAIVSRCRLGKWEAWDDERREEEGKKERKKVKEQRPGKAKAKAE